MISLSQAIRGSRLDADSRLLMRIKRARPILLVVVLVAAVLTLLVQLRKHAPPEPARLLPGADGFFYVNLQWMRRANVSGQLPSVSHDAEYERFIQETGFQFERDLNQAAFAIHYPSSQPRGGNANPKETRFSEVFVGKIEGDRLAAYLRKLASKVDTYRSIDIYEIPLEGRTLRVAILGVDTVAASNHNDPEVIRGIIDRSRKLASPFAGPAFLRKYYKDIPLASLGWAIFKVQPSDQGAISASPVSLSFLFSKPAVIVASMRYLGSVHFRAEAYTADNAEAQRVAEQAGTFLNIFREAENSVSGSGPDPDVKRFLDSLKIEQQSDQAVLSANLPLGLIRKAIAQSPELAYPATSDQPESK